MSDYVCGDMRGAELQLAQRHRKLVPGHFTGHLRLEPEIPHPGVTGQLALAFTTSGRMPRESRLTCVLPDHGWDFPFVKDEGLRAVLRLPPGLPSVAIKGVWHPATRMLEFTLVGNEEVPAGTATVIILSGVATPEAATPAAEATLTSYEKLVVRNTVPPSTRGGQVIDGPTAVTISRIVPGEIGGRRRWQPFNCWPGTVSDVTLGFAVHGQIPRHGRILLELPPDGWEMDDAPTVHLRTPEFRDAALSGRWQREQRTLEIDVGSRVIKPGTALTLVVSRVTNPAKETMHGNPTTAARVTTLVATGGVIDGPTKIDVAWISELRELDFVRAESAFREAASGDLEGLVSVDKVPELLKRTGVALTSPMMESLLTANLPIRIEPSPPEDASLPAAGVTTVATATATAPAPGLSRLEFLNLFAQIFTPAHKFGQELRLAAGRGQVERISELIRRGCDPNAKDGSGWGALHYAADFGQLAALETLVECATILAAEVGTPTLTLDLRDTSGWTPLMCAAANGHTPIVERLLTLGSDASLASADGRTALHWAVTRGMDRTAAVLLAAGVSRDAVDRCGWSALHCATLHGHASCAQLLADHGADPSLADRLGHTAARFVVPKDEVPPM